MDFEPTLSPGFVTYIRNYLMDRDVKPEPLFIECGISIEADKQYEAPIPVSKIANLIELTTKVTNSSYVGMQMGQQFHFENSGLIVLAMLAAPSVEEGLHTLSRYDKYVDTAIETAFEVGAEVSAFSTNLLNPKHANVDQLNEYLMTFLVQTLNTATRKQMPLTEVWFRHHCTRDTHPLEKFFDARIKFGQTDTKIIFSSSFLKERFFTSNNLLFDILKNALKAYHVAPGEIHGFADAVCREIIRLTTNESPSIESVAESMTISARTLRRRLKEEGYSFQEVKNLAREQRAKYYLANTNMPLSEVAFELGFSELSAFSRAFRSWTDNTPQAFRDKSRKMLRA